MSMAKKCDICGELYENYGRNPRGRADKPNSLVLACREYDDNSYMRMEFYDCCPNCMQHIQTLIESIRVPAMAKVEKEDNDGNKN